MKTKLLRRLRKEANRMIYPAVLNGKLCIKNQYGSYLCRPGYSYSWGIWAVEDFTFDRPNMEKMITQMRRKYILQLVSDIRLRKTYKS